MVIGVNNMIIYIYIWISDNAIVTPTHQVGEDIRTLALLVKGLGSVNEIHGF